MLLLYSLRLHNFVAICKGEMTFPFYRKFPELSIDLFKFCGYLSPKKIVEFSKSIHTLMNAYWGSIVFCNVLVKGFGDFNMKNL